MSIPYLDKANSGVFYAKWTDGRRSKRKSMGTRDPAVAQARFAQWLLIGGASGRPENPAQVYTVADLWGVYDKQHVREKVMDPATHDFSWKHLGAHFGDMLLGDVSEAVPAYIAKREKGLIGRPSKSPTIRRELALLRACFNWCADAKERRALIGVGDVPGFALPADSVPRDRWLKEAEIARLMAAAEAKRVGDRLSRVERFLWLALETAGRKQALLDLTWDRVDFETNVIHLALPGRKQTRKRRASVPISRTLLPVLKRAYEERAGDLVLDHGGDIWAGIQVVAAAAGFGSHKAGARPSRTGISPHVMRHTAATHMARRGVSLWKVAKILGDNIATVEKTYAKHAPEDLQDAVNMISGK